MNVKDAEVMEEKPDSHSRDSGRNLRKAEIGEHQTDTARREEVAQETTSLMEAVLRQENTVLYRCLKRR